MILRVKTSKGCVVVNALITPQEEFAVRLNWSGTYTDGTKFKAVADAEIRLYENNAEVINCPADREGITATDFVPTAGRHYRLVVTVPNYGELSAETDIPQAPAGSLVFARQKGWIPAFRYDGVDGPGRHQVGMDSGQAQIQRLEGCL